MPRSCGSGWVFRNLFHPPLPGGNRLRHQRLCKSRKNRACQNPAGNLGKLRPGNLRQAGLYIPQLFHKVLPGGHRKDAHRISEYEIAQKVPAQKQAPFLTWITRSLRFPGQFPECPAASSQQSASGHSPFPLWSACSRALQSEIQSIPKLADHT